jgi:hypothetical protein
MDGWMGWDVCLNDNNLSGGRGRRKGGKYQWSMVGTSMSLKKRRDRKGEEEREREREREREEIPLF